MEALKTHSSGLHNSEKTDKNAGKITAFFYCSQSTQMARPYLINFINAYSTNCNDAIGISS
jgi:hypothetical protein